MGRMTHHYLVFETAGGFCGIAWNDVGITRFQLPTKSAEATERILLRRVPGAEPGTPTPEVAEAITAVKRYFEGVETDFSGFKLDLGEQNVQTGWLLPVAARPERLLPDCTERDPVEGDQASKRAATLAK